MEFVTTKLTRLPLLECMVFGTCVMDNALTEIWFKEAQLLFSCTKNISPRRTNYANTPMNVRYNVGDKT